MREKKQTSVMEFDYDYVMGSPYYLGKGVDNLSEKFIASVAEQYNLLRGLDHILPHGGPKHRVGARIATVFDEQIKPILKAEDCDLQLKVIANQFAESLTQIPEHDYSYTKDTFTKKSLCSSALPVVGQMYSAIYWNSTHGGCKVPDYDGHKEEIKAAFSEIVGNVKDKSTAELVTLYTALSGSANKQATEVFSRESSSNLERALEDYKYSDRSALDDSHKEENATMEDFKKYRSDLIKSYFPSRQISATTPKTTIEATDGTGVSSTRNNQNTI